MYRTEEQIKEIISEMQCRILTMDKNKMFRDDWTTGQHILHWLECLEEQMKIQKDDKATGLEILAAMSREEQKRFLGGDVCPGQIWLKELKTMNCNCGCDACRWRALRPEYTYRNGKWEGEK